MMPHKRSIYFLRCGDAIKIGCSTRIKTRIEQIEKDIGQRVELLGFIFGSFATERLIHKRLASHAEGNEWFQDCGPVRVLIDHLIKNGPQFGGLPPV